MYSLWNMFLYMYMSCIEQRGLPLGREHHGPVWLSGVRSLASTSSAAECWWDEPGPRCPAGPTPWHWVSHQPWLPPGTALYMFSSLYCRWTKSKSVFLLQGNTGISLDWLVVKVEREKCGKDLSSTPKFIGLFRRRSTCDLVTQWMVAFFYNISCFLTW